MYITSNNDYIISSNKLFNQCNYSVDVTKGSSYIENKSYAPLYLTPIIQFSIKKVHIFRKYNKYFKMIFLKMYRQTFNCLNNIST